MFECVLVHEKSHTVTLCKLDVIFNVNSLWFIIPKQYAEVERKLIDLCWINLDDNDSSCL